MEDSSKAAMVNYNDDSIRTMEGLKHIRLRPGMYIGALGDGTEMGQECIRRIGSNQEQELWGCLEGLSGKPAAGRHQLRQNHEEA